VVELSSVTFRDPYPLKSGLIAGAWRAFGKGGGFMAFAFFTAGGTMLLRARGVEVASLTGPLGVIAAGLFGGGAWKAAAEAKNGKGNK
jgi:hypothetical protein